MAIVRLDVMLREFTPRRTVTSTATSVREMMEELERDQPKLQYRVRDENGDLRKFMRIFVNGRLIEELNGLETRLGPKDEVDILHSIQGG